MALSQVHSDERQQALAVKARLRAESQLIARLMAAEPLALHDECEALGLPHEGRNPGELRAALFNLLRRRLTG